MSDKYAEMTTEEFDAQLAEIMDEEPRPSALLSIDGVYECVSEHYNNDILARWEGKQQEKKNGDPDQ
jgi:hypothetical protein